MELNKEMFLKDEDRSEQQTKKPEAWREEAEMSLSEKDLEKDFFIDGNGMNPVREGEGMGGENFGQNNLTPSANDKNNPSQYAGNTNAYFDRTEPSEEHPENSNFRDKKQGGASDYDKAQLNSATNIQEPKPEKVERGDGENDRPHKGETHQEGTADNDQVNIPGPGELPDQQKVGEDDSEEDKNQIEN